MAGQGYAPVRLSGIFLSFGRQPNIALNSTLTSPQVASADDNEHLSSAPIPSSPPPSFRSNDSTPRASHTGAHRRTNSQPRDDLADAFDADGSDSERENDGDDRQRLMRGTPSASAASPGSATPAGGAQTDGAIQLSEAPAAPRPVGQAPIQGRVYGGGSGDGVWANLSAKPERGEKLIEEFPPVCYADLPLLNFCTNKLYRPMRQQQQTQHLHIGKQPSSHPAVMIPTKSTSTACRSAPSSPLFGTPPSPCRSNSSVSSSPTSYTQHTPPRMDQGPDWESR